MKFYSIKQDNLFNIFYIAIAKYLILNASFFNQNYCNYQSLLTYEFNSFHSIIDSAKRTEGKN